MNTAVPAGMTGRSCPVADFLLELFSEEIPARMQAKACDDLARLFNEQMADAGLKAGAVETYATPRRLALIARGLPLETEAVREERRGPRADAPEQALRSEEHTSELQSLMRISYAVFCLQKKKNKAHNIQLR